MGATSKLNTVYLVYFIIHIPILFCMASTSSTSTRPPGTPPRARWRPWATCASTTSRATRTSSSAPRGSPRFFPLFCFLELVFHLPVSVWAVNVLSANKTRLRGRDELLFFLYGVETALTTATCMWEAYGWSEELVTGAEKVTLIGGLYGSYFAVALLLSVDMWVRLTKKLEAGDKVKKVQ
ncbi:hypothetical protein PG994_012872 [Apiospora phragmitis]|uniref:Efficient mitochondria targeting-associated protein 19 n=1 Tax=Apiospora phragmitis TaxID=2905665 RepID=A0ABR1T714_9PEZI